MNHKELAKTYQGIECTVVWRDSPDGEEDVFISFLPLGSETKSDLETFYYFSEEEVEGLLDAITTDWRERYSVNKEWWIELACDYSLVCK
jgi:hypothetical protein